jgi:Flp pilus assembly protein TadG
MRSRFNTKKISRKESGFGHIEIAITACLMIALAAYGLDLTLIMFGMSLNDSACRDAARAAAQQSTVTQATQAAQSQMQIHYVGTNWISQPVISSTVYNDYSGNPPANTSPYVAITTTTTIKCPVPIIFLGNKSQGSTIQFSRTYTFPIVKEHFYG